MTATDSELLKEYVKTGSETAFTNLVNRHLSTAYLSALRQLRGNEPAAQDVAQRVFIALARKAPHLINHPSLSGWVHRATRLAATDEIRRICNHDKRAKQFAEMNQTPEFRNEPSDAELSAKIDRWLDNLPSKYREAVSLRFFQKLPYSQIAQLMNISSDAARMRIERALEKLRAKAERRGVRSSAAAIATLLAEQNGFTAPPATVAQISSKAVSSLGGATVGWNVTSLITVKVAATAAVCVAGVSLAALEYRRSFQVSDSVLASSANSEHRQDSPAPSVNSAESQQPVLSLTNEKDDRLRVLIAAIRKKLTKMDSFDPAALHLAKVNKDYAKLLAGMSKEQRDRFMQLVLRERALIGERDEGIKNGTFASYDEAMTYLRARSKQIEEKLKEELGADLYLQYRDTTDLLPIDQKARGFAITAATVGISLSEQQIIKLEDSMLEASRVTHADLWFDPINYRYSMAQFYDSIATQDKAYEITVKDAASYLAPEQVIKLKQFFQNQVRGYMSHRTGFEDRGKVRQFVDPRTGANVVIHNP
jgi:RNA polymerase sigma factor (sigma-70 family)